MNFEGSRRGCAASGAALRRAGNAEASAVLGDRPAGDGEALLLEQLGKPLVRKRIRLVLPFDEGREPFVDDLLRDLLARSGRDAGREEAAQLDRAARRRRVLVVHRARDRRVVDADLVRDLLHRERAEPLEPLLEKAGLRVEDRLRDVRDRLLAPLHRLDEGVDRRDAAADVLLRLAVRAGVREHPLVLRGDVDVGEAAVVHARHPALRGADGVDLGVDVGDGLPGRAERAARPGLERTELHEDVAVALQRHARLAQDLRDVPLGDVREVAFDELADVLAERRAVELVELGEQTFLRRARAASGRVEVHDLAEDGEYLRLARARDHLHVRDRADEPPVGVQLADEDLGEGDVRGVDVGHRELAEEVFLERLLLRLRVEEPLAALVGLLVAREDRRRAELGLVVLVGVALVLLAALLALGLAHLLRDGRPLQRRLDVLDARVLAHLPVERLAELRQVHREHFDAVAHLRRQRRRLSLPRPRP